MKDKTVDELLEELKQKTSSTSTGNYLKKYGRNLNKLAKEGKIDRGVGRDLELTTLAMVLSKRKKSNAVLVGEAGIGKSQTVYDLAHKISHKDYDGPLKGKQIWEVSTTAIISGASYVGMSEERMKGLLEEAKQDNIILFWDELHTMVGAGAGSKSNNDLSNMVKPALAGGEISVIGATTPIEYKIIENDKALTRRFNKIQVSFLSDDEVLEVLHGIKYLYERHHGILYNPASIRILPIISNKYSGMNNPDSSIDLMDTAGAIKRSSKNRWEKGGNKVFKTDVINAASMLYSTPAEEIAKFVRNK